VSFVNIPCKPVKSRSKPTPEGLPGLWFTGFLPAFSNSGGRLLPAFYRLFQHKKAGNLPAFDRLFLENIPAFIGFLAAWRFFLKL